MSARAVLPLLVFPAVQVAALAAAAGAAQPWQCALWLALAAIAVDLTVHISVHEWVHRGRGWAAWLGLPATLLIGLPADGYRLHHRNHHRHANGPGDHSSTWRQTPQGPRPRQALAYALAWPGQLLRARAAVRGSVLAAGRRRRLRAQQALLALALLALAAWSPWHLAAWLAVIYLGWALVALRNYGQHPPRPGVLATSYPARWYNRLFANNGLHWEHHHQPGLPWSRLAGDAAATRTRWPHPLNLA